MLYCKWKLLTKSAYSIYYPNCMVMINYTNPRCLMMIIVPNSHFICNRQICKSDDFTGFNTMSSVFNHSWDKCDKIHQLFNLICIIKPKKRASFVAASPALISVITFQCKTISFCILNTHNMQEVEVAQNFFIIASIINSISCH